MEYEDGLLKLKMITVAIEHTDIGKECAENKITISSLAFSGNLAISLRIFAAKACLKDTNI